MAKLFKYLTIITLCLTSTSSHPRPHLHNIRESFFAAIELGNIAEVEQLIATYPDLVHERYKKLPLLYFVHTQALPEVRNQLIHIISAKRLQIRLQEIASLGWRLNTQAQETTSFEPLVER